VQKFSNEHLGLGVFAFDGCHVLAANFFGVDICHWVKVGIALSFALMYSSTMLRRNKKYARICCCF
jgi:hypothetical protein